MRILVHILTSTCYYGVCVFSIKTIPVDVKWYHSVFICISLMMNDTEHLFMGQLSIFFGELSTQILCPFLNLTVFLLLSCQSSLCILDTGLLPGTRFVNICKLSFPFLDVLHSTKYFNFADVQFLFFLWLFMRWVLYLGRFCLTQGHEYLLILSSKSFIVLASTFRSMIHLEFISVCGMRKTISSQQTPPFSWDSAQPQCFPPKHTGLKGASNKAWMSTESTFGEKISLVFFFTSASVSDVDFSAAC